MGVQIAADEIRLIRRNSLESFEDFLHNFWEEVVPEAPVWNWHIAVLCKELQTVAERVFRMQEKEYDLILNQPPGTTKSTVASVAFPAWTMARMQTARSLCGSYAFPLAMDLSRKCRDLVNSEKYRSCFPQVQWKDDQDTKGYFATTKGGYRYAFGVGGSVTGMHGHFLIVDDPLDPSRAVSDLELNTANTWMDETLSQRKVNKSVTPIILVMQRLHQNDPTGNMLGKGGSIRQVCLPAELTDDVKPKELRKYYEANDGLLDPVRLSRKVLEEARITLGDFGYAGQFGQNPVPRGGGMFKTDRILIGTPPITFQKVVRFWDKAGTQDGGMWSAGIKMGRDMDGRYWILNMTRGQWGTDVREATIKKTAGVDGKRVWIGVEQEPGSGGKDSALSTVKNLAGYAVLPEKPSGDKEARAYAFSVQVNNGNVYMAPGPWVEKYLEELKYFPYSKYKDQVDASSGAFNLLTKTKTKVGAL